MEERKNYMRGREKLLKMEGSGRCRKREERMIKGGDSSGREEEGKEDKKEGKD